MFFHVHDILFSWGINDSLHSTLRCLQMYPVTIICLSHLHVYMRHALHQLIYSFAFEMRPTIDAIISIRNVQLTPLTFVFCMLVNIIKATLCNFRLLFKVSFFVRQII